MSHKQLAVHILLVGMLIASFAGSTQVVQAAPGAPDGFRLPFKGSTNISQGPRCPSFSHWGSENHEAIDFALPKYYPVIATESGWAQPIFNDPYGGNMVKIYHNNGLISIYAHLNDFAYLRYSGWVEKGRWIGNVGQTGRADGPHLHFAVIDRSGNPIPIHNLPGIKWNSTYYPSNPNSTCPRGGYDGYANGPWN